MDPTSYAHYKHNQKGMIFLRIRGGGLLNFEPMGKSLVSAVNPFDLLTFPCLIQLPPLKALLLVGAVMAR